MYKEGDYNDDCVIRFQNNVMNSEWFSLYTLGTVNEMCGSMCEILFRIYDEWFPMVTRFKIKIDFTKPYNTAELICLIDQKKMTRA